MKKLTLVTLIFALPLMAQTLSIHNPNTDLKDGETSEYSTLETILKELEGNNIVIGVGEAFPSPEAKLAHEVFVLKSGNELKAFQSANGTGVPEALNATSALTFSVFASMDPTTGIEMIYDKPEQAGRVLWNFHKDNTGKLGRHFHNSYNSTDNSATNTLFDAAVNFHKPGFDGNKARKNLAKYIPDLSKENIWTQFRTTMGATELETTWLATMRANKWEAAAFVIEGSLMNVNHFRVTKVNSSGLKPKDYQLENNAEVSNWTIVGTVIDPLSKNFKSVQEAMEAFGQGIHFHGIRNDNKKIGHILTAVLSHQPLKVKLFPIQISSDLGISNNDLIASQDATTFSLENKGANFIRNLKYRITQGNRTLETREATVVMPNQKIQISLTKGQCLVIDPDKDVLEGGAGRNNNSVCAR